MPRHVETDKMRFDIGGNPFTSLPRHSRAHGWLDSELLQMMVQMLRL